MSSGKEFARPITQLLSPCCQVMLYWVLKKKRHDVLLENHHVQLNEGLTDGW